MENQTVPESDSAIAESLRQRGLRVTAARHAILKWLSSHPHASADQVHQGVVEQLGTLSKQAVYDVLSASVEAELVRQIKPSGHPARFERRRGDNHHHLVCTHCGRVEDTDCKHGHAPCLTPDDAQGFVIHEAEILFWGVCSRCRANTETRPDKA